MSEANIRYDLERVGSGSRAAMVIRAVSEAILSADYLEVVLDVVRVWIFAFAKLCELVVVSLAHDRCPTSWRWVIELLIPGDIPHHVHRRDVELRVSAVVLNIDLMELFVLFRLPETNLSVVAQTKRMTCFVRHCFGSVFGAEFGTAGDPSEEWGEIV